MLASLDASVETSGARCRVLGLLGCRISDKEQGLGFGFKGLGA